MVTIFRNITTTGTPYYITLEKVVQRIKEGKSKDIISAIRKEKDNTLRNELKRDLPSLCISGKFTHRSDSAMQEHSGLVCLDFDKFPTKKEMNSFRETLMEDDYTCCLFTSPSGDGLKLIVKIPPSKEDHKSYFDALNEYYGSPYFDEKCSNLSRVCYESFDPNVYYNPESEIWNEKAIDQGNSYLDTSTEVIIPLFDQAKIIEKLMIWFNKNYNMSEGGRNNNLFILASAFNEYGIQESIAADYLSQFSEKGFPVTEIEHLVSSAYLKTRKHGTKYFEDKETISHVAKKLSSGVSKEQISVLLNLKGVSEDKHDKVIDEAEKIKDGETFWDVNPKKNEVITGLNPSKFKVFLENNNFFKYYNFDAEIPTFVKITNGQVEEINVIKIKDFVLKYLEEMEQTPVWNHCAAKTSYFTENYLNMIKDEELDLLLDGPGYSYICYNNGVLKITKDKRTLIEYADIGHHVWKNHVLARDYHESNSKSDFEQFIANICNNDQKRITSMESTIGYMMHSYKSQKEQYAVILNDEDDDDVPNGGSGKSLLMTALGKFRRVEEINGKSFDPNKSFTYQRVSTDTQIIGFDDVKSNFDFESLFSLITQGIEIERKGKDAFYIPFEKSPKILISTNYVIKGNSDSHKRRRWELELHQHYGAQRTPMDDFGKKFWEDWDQEEWAAFDNYIIRCLQFYLKEGLHRGPIINLDRKNLISGTSREFVFWCEDPDKPITANTKIMKQDAYDDFIKQHKDQEKFLKRQKFTIWLKKYAGYKNWEIKETHDSFGKYLMFLDGTKEFAEYEEEESPLGF